MWEKKTLFEMEYRRLVWNRVLSKAIWQISPYFKHKILLEEFEVCVTLRVTTSTANLKPVESQ